ncbi:thiamine-binding protein [bacterium]|nr:MAG: thiamine-binding protein [bacterium]
MAIMEISVVPVGTGGTSLSKYVARAFEVVRKSNLKYELTPMGTVIEGPIDELFNLAREIHEVCFSMGIKRVLTTIKIDDRRDREGTMEQKKRSVEEKLDV